VYGITKKLKIAHDSVKAIAKEKDLYRYQYITEQHLKLILFISTQSPEELQKNHKPYLEPFLKLQEIESLYIKSEKETRRF
jgi:hypothetical protein